MGNSRPEDLPPVWRVDVSRAGQRLRTAWRAAEWMTAFAVLGVRGSLLWAVYAGVVSRDWL